jgi:anti-anti-sigma factor
MPEARVTSIEHLPAAVVVHVLVHELGKSEVDGLCSGIDEALATTKSLPFILDMAHVGFVPSLAMGVLVGLNQEFRTRSQQLIFVGLQANVRQSFTMTRINRVVQILDDVPTALRTISGNV